MRSGRRGVSAGMCRCDRGGCGGRSGGSGGFYVNIHSVHRDCVVPGSSLVNAKVWSRL